MGKFKFAVIFLLCNGFVLFFASQARAQEEAEIDKIIKDVLVDSQKGAISDFTYQMKFTYNQHRLMGRKFSRLYEAILPSRFATNRNYQHPLILLEDSEKTISTVDVINARKELAKKFTNDENNADKQATQNELDDNGGYWTVQFAANGKEIQVNIIKLLGNAAFSNLIRKQINGKNVVSIDFVPKTDAALSKTLSYMSKIEGQILIDEADKRIIRIEGFAPGDFILEKDKPDAEREKVMVLLFSQTKVTEGFWFPQIVRLNLANIPDRPEADEVEFVFNNYNKARVDIKETVEAPKDPATQKPVETPKDTTKQKSAETPKDAVKQNPEGKTIN